MLPQPIWRVLDLINKMQQTAIKCADDGGSDARGAGQAGGPRSKQDQRPFLEANSQQSFGIFAYNVRLRIAGSCEGCLKAVSD